MEWPLRRCLFQSKRQDSSSYYVAFATWADTVCWWNMVHGTSTKLPLFKRKFCFHFWWRDWPSAWKPQGFVLLHWLQQRREIWETLFSCVYQMLPQTLTALHNQTRGTEAGWVCEATPQPPFELGPTCPPLLSLCAPNTYNPISA